jgi:DNA-directed RNA polymerase specialized sigma24 family protein
VVAAMNDAVAAYEGHITSLARKYQGYADAEYDDLAQEGRIAVWTTLVKGIQPSTQVIEGRMLNWIRYIRRLQSNDQVAYDELLPIEVSTEE